MNYSDSDNKNRDNDNNHTSNNNTHSTTNSSSNSSNRLPAYASCRGSFDYPFDLPTF